MRVRARLAGEESGFTLVEMMVAIGVMVIALLGLAYTATVAFSDVALARQRQSANGLASQAIEQVRALPFDTVKKGLSSNDTTIASDTNITTCGSDKCYGGEVIPLSGYASGTSIVPLVNHRRTITVGQTTYTQSVYVTYYNNDQTSNTFRVTAEVSWTASSRAGALHRVQVQTVLFSPSGCLSTATHPFAAPCQPFLYGTATSGQGRIDVTGTIQGVSFERASVWRNSYSASAQVEQTSHVQGVAYSAGVSLKLPNSSETYAGHVSTSSSADNDPSSTGTEYSRATYGPQGATSPLTAAGTSNSISVTASSGGTTSSTSTTSANATNACADPSGANQTDSQPCGNTQAVQGGTSTAVLALTAGSTSLGNATLVSVAAPSGGTPGIGYVKRDLAPQTGVCTGATGDGCIHAEASRTIGTIRLGGLPASLPAADVPAGWQGYLFQLTSSTESASAEAGIGSVAPTASQSATVSYWIGGSYRSCVITANGCTSSGAFPVTEVHITDNAFTGGQLKIDMTTSLTRGAPTTTSTGSPRTSAQGQVTSAVTGDVFYTVTYGGTVIANLTIHIDLDKLLAKATYTASPSG